VKEEPAKNNKKKGSGEEGKKNLAQCRATPKTAKSRGTSKSSNNKGEKKKEKRDYRRKNSFGTGGRANGNDKSKKPTKKGDPQGHFGREKIEGTKKCLGGWGGALEHRPEAPDRGDLRNPSRGLRKELKKLDPRRGTPTKNRKTVGTLSGGGNLGEWGVSGHICRVFHGGKTKEKENKVEKVE